MHADGRQLTGARAPAALAPGLGAALVASVLAVAVGLAVAFDLRIGTGLAFAALAVPVALVDLPLVIALWAALAVFSQDPAFGQATSAVGLVVVGAWLAHARGHRATLRSALRPHKPLLALVGLLLAWLTLSLAWSRDVGAAAGKLVDWYVAAAVLVVFVTSVRTPRDVRLVVGALVLAVVAAVGFALAGVQLGPPQTDPTVSTEGRLEGAIGDPNFMAAFIVGAVVLCLALAAIVGPVSRALLVPAALLLVVGLAATASRGGLLAALAALVTAVALLRGRRGTVLAAGTLAALVAAVWFSANPAAVERLQSIREDRGSGREDLWLVARRVTVDHPIGGVGLANFTVRSREYVRRPGTLEYVALIVDRPHVVHNTYLGMLAETGAVGFGLFLALVAAA
ncbi:MAG: O-antigen ligase family protein, partial [Actinomycetota bacterium]|nr:O-antigen ligase family protein [Actinomycetota bacterium]